MPVSAIGVLLQKLREKRGLSLRELGLLAELNHTYVYRLETGDKEAPSPEALAKLMRALKPSKRDAEVLQYFIEHPNASAGLAEYAMEDETVTADEVAVAAGVVYRGPVRQDYKTVIARVRRMLGE